MKPISHIIVLLMFIIMCPLASCSDGHVINWIDNDVVADSLLTKLDLRVAVFTSKMDHTPKDKLGEVANWVKSLWNNSGMNVSTNIAIQWCDADSIGADNLQEYATQLIHTGTIDAIIAPADFAEQKAIAKACDIEGELMLIPYSVSDALVRDMTAQTTDSDDDKYMWVIGEGLSTEVQVALSVCSVDLCDSIYYIGKKDDETAEFLQCMKDEITERGFKSFVSRTYDNVDDETALKNVCSVFSSCGAKTEILLAPGSDEELLSILEYYSDVRTSKKNAIELRFPTLKDEYADFTVDHLMPMILIMDFPVSENLHDRYASLFTSNITVVSPSGNPNTGYTEGYHARIGNYPYSSAYFYDALHLLLTSRYMQKTADWNTDLYGNIRSLVLQKEDNNENMAWHPGSVFYKQSLRQLTNKTASSSVALGGASGTLSSVLEPFIGYTTFDRWTLHDGSVRKIESYSSNPDAADYVIDPTVVSGGYDVGVEYTSDVDEHWAVIVDASPGFDNYRFESSSFAFYKLLREKYNFDDDHILLIAGDEAAKNNDDRLYVEVDNGSCPDYSSSKNVYMKDIIDWDIHTTTLEDLQKAFTGEYDGHLAIHPTRNSNVSVFWFGHGTKSGLVWNYDDDNIEDSNTAHLFGRDDFDFLCSKLECHGGERMFNKLFWFTEACEAGCTITGGEDKPGMLFLNSCKVGEESRACNSNGSNYLCNESTYVMYNDLRHGNDISIYSLYEDLTKNTYGSHPVILNEDHFGLASQCRISEFLNF